MIEVENNCVNEENGEKKEEKGNLIIDNNTNGVENSEDIEMQEPTEDLIQVPTNVSIEVQCLEGEIVPENGEIRQTKMDYDRESEDLSQEIQSSGLSNTQTSDIKYFNEFKLMELSRYSWRSSVSKQRFLKGCIWSPDGTCILTVVNCDGMHVVEMPQDLYGFERIPEDRPLDVLQSAVHVKEGGLVYDYCWYPFMNSNDSSTCCWLASRQHEPIQLWDAYKGDLICSYRGYNAVDEVEAAISVCFSTNGQDVIGGYRNSVKIFKTNIPGRDFTSIPIKLPVSAVVSSFDLVAFGSWQGNISIYDNREAQWNFAFDLKKYKAGITQLKFIKDQNILLSGARKNNLLIFWDVRNTAKPLLELSRNVDTNQRIYFDVSSDESWLLSGDTSGMVRAWDIKSLNVTKEYKFPVHHDCCNGVSIHPSKPILATSSGQHHYAHNELIYNGEVEEVNGVEAEKVNGIEARSCNPLTENSLILWWCGLSTLNDL